MRYHKCSLNLNFWSHSRFHVKIFLGGSLGTVIVKNMGNQFEYAAVIGCLKTLLFIFNIFLWLLGLLFLAVGFWAEIDLNNYVEMSPEFSGTASYVFIGIGLLIFIVSTLAFSCIIKAQSVLLYMYSGFLACITMMCTGVIAALTCYRHTFAKALYDGLNQAVIDYSKIKTNLDFAQIKMHCCGVNNYTDWIRMSPQRVIPLSCCLDPNDCVTANYSHVFQRGCYQVISQAMRDNMELFVFLAGMTITLPTFGTILGCILASVVNKSKYDVMD